jgi:hypothetical protein
MKQQHICKEEVLVIQKSTLTKNNREENIHTTIELDIPFLIQQWIVINSFTRIKMHPPEKYKKYTSIPNQISKCNGKTMEKRKIIQ